MSKAAAPSERTRSAGVSELPVVATCRECSLVGTWEASGDGDHPHAEATGHEVGVAGMGDLPWDRELPLHGGPADV